MKCRFCCEEGRLGVVFEIVVVVSFSKWRDQLKQRSLLKQLHWWRSKLCSTPKIFKCAYLKSESIYVYCVSILIYIYIYWHARYSLQTLKMHIQKPNPLLHQKNLIKFACFSCASDSLLSFSSSCWMFWCFCFRGFHSNDLFKPISEGWRDFTSSILRVGKLTTHK